MCFVNKHGWPRCSLLPRPRALTTELWTGKVDRCCSRFIHQERRHESTDLADIGGLRDHRPGVD